MKVAVSIENLKVVCWTKKSRRACIPNKLLFELSTLADSGRWYHGAIPFSNHYITLLTVSYI